MIRAAQATSWRRIAAGEDVGSKHSRPRRRRRTPVLRPCENGGVTDPSSAASLMGLPDPGAGVSVGKVAIEPRVRQAGREVRREKIGGWCPSRKLRPVARPCTAQPTSVLLPASRGQPLRARSTAEPHSGYGAARATPVPARPVRYDRVRCSAYAKPTPDRLVHLVAMYALAVAGRRGDRGAQPLRLLGHGLGRAHVRRPCRRAGGAARRRRHRQRDRAHRLRSRDATGARLLRRRPLAGPASATTTICVVSAETLVCGGPIGQLDQV
jgi:hypothetical protein